MGQQKIGTTTPARTSGYYLNSPTINGKRTSLRPEVVATWNRGKGPIDVSYSRFQKKHQVLAFPSRTSGYNLVAVKNDCGIQPMHTIHSIWVEHQSFLPARNAHASGSSKRNVNVNPRSVSLSTSCKRSNSWGCSFYCLLQKQWWRWQPKMRKMMATKDRNHHTRKNQWLLLSISYNKRQAYFTRPELIARRQNQRIPPVVLRYLLQSQAS
jgi:hypothetical protein